VNAQDACAVASRVINRARWKRRPFAVFVSADGFEIVRARGDMYERAMKRYPHNLVGVYDHTASQETVVSDIMAMPVVKAVA
jgi:transposase